MNKSKVNSVVVVPWHNEDQIAAFLKAWDVEDRNQDWLVLQQDKDREGCGRTKNKGVAEAVRRGAEVVVVLDDDCFPARRMYEGFGRFRSGLLDLAAAHYDALIPQDIELLVPVTNPPSRGTPYTKRTARLQVAASMGFWNGVGDHDALSQLMHGPTPMQCKPQVIFGRYFPLCGMNLAFRPREWLPWCQFIEVPRFDDIWMGWLWQREAYRRGCCFNLRGPIVEHSRQSNVWRNLEQETPYLERNETLWSDIALAKDSSYEGLRKLLPV